MRQRKRPGCAAALLVVVLAIGGFWAWHCFCGWRITQLAVQVLPPKDPFVYASPLRLSPPALREPNDRRPWWENGPIKVHCTRSGDELTCPDAVDAIHGVEPEGQYELDVEVSM